MGTRKGVKRNDLLPQTQPGDNTRFLRQGLDLYDLPPVDISDAAQVEARINFYFGYCAEHDMKVGVVGLCLALGIDRTTFYHWANGTYRSKTHHNMVKKAQNYLEFMWEQYMLNGKINPVSGIFLGKNHFGYADKREFEITPKNPMTEGLESAEAVAARYRELPDEDESTPVGPLGEV